MKRKGLDLALAVAGSFESIKYEAHIKDVVSSKGLEPQITWHNQVENPMTLLSMSRMLVLPSYREGLSRVVLEAMACKVPVVATSVGGIPEIITNRDFGVLVRPGDPKHLAEGIEELLADHALQTRLAHNAYERVKQRFSKQQFGNRLRAIVRVALASS